MSKVAEIEAANQMLVFSNIDLRDDWKFKAARNSLREEAAGFLSSKRGKQLEAKFWRVPQQVFSDLKICWDYRLIANRLNWEASDENIHQASLYECELKQLFWLLSNGVNYHFDNIFDNVEKNLFLRVVGFWELGIPLTPPFLKLQRGELLKTDGFHRLAVAFAAKPSIIPFWSNLPLDLMQRHKITARIPDN